MNKNVIMNMAMKRIFRFNFMHFMSSPQEGSIEDEINTFFTHVKMYRKDEQKCFSTKNIFNCEEYTQNANYSALQWEWDTNEIYLDKSIIKRQYKKSIVLATSIIEKILHEKFPMNSFVISVFVQFGRFRNINIRICQDLEETILDKDLDKYNQPIMQICIST